MGQGLCHLSRWQRRNHGGEQRAKYILLHLFSMPILTHTTLVKVAFRFSDSLILSLLRSSMSLKWLLTRKTRDSWNWCLDYSTETGRQRTPPPPPAPATMIRSTEEDQSGILFRFQLWLSPPKGRNTGGVVQQWQAVCQMPWNSRRTRKSSGNESSGKGTTMGDGDTHCPVKGSRQA